jgi:hypothetical protein
MSKISIGGRVYVADIDDFAYKQRTMLNIADSAVILADTGLKKGYVGIVAKEKLVDPITSTNALDVPFDLPLDWRVTGIQILDGFGVPKVTQGAMFDNFINNYTVEQRRTFIDMYKSIDPNDSAALSSFVNNMLSMLVGGG